MDPIINLKPLWMLKIFGNIPMLMYSSISKFSLHRIGKSIKNKEM